MMVLYRLFAVVLIGGAGFNLANAAIILHDENLNGDLAPTPAITPDVDEPLQLFNLQVGQNQISGTMNLRAVTGIPFDIDAFAFRIPVNAFVDSILLETSKQIGGASFLRMSVSPGIQFNNSNIDDPPRPAILGGLGTAIDGSILATPVNASYLPLSSGEYSMSYDYTVIDDTPVLQENPFSWSMTFNVTAVPEPGTTLPLLATGAFWTCRRKRRH